MNEFIYGQLNPKIRFSPIILREQSSPFRIIRTKEYNAKYNIGVGADIFLYFSKYLDKNKNGIRFGPSIGQYYFWNKKIKTIEYNFEYKENNLVSPICLNIGFGNNPLIVMKKSKGIIYSFDIAFGQAYVQNSIIGVKSNEIIINKYWKNVFKIKFNIVSVNLKRLFPLLSIGIEYTNIDGKNFGAVNY